MWPATFFAVHLRQHRGSAEVSVRTPADWGVTAPLSSTRESIPDEQVKIDERPALCSSENNRTKGRVKMPSNLATFLSRIALIAPILIGSQAQSVSNACPPGFGSCTLQDPSIINVYYETTPQAWAADVAATPGPGTGTVSPGTASMTIDRIDAFEVNEAFASVVLAG